MEQNSAVKMESVAMYMGQQALTIVQLQEKIQELTKAIDELQQQLLKYQKGETT